LSRRRTVAGSQFLIFSISQFRLSPGFGLSELVNYAQYSYIFWQKKEVMSRELSLTNATKEISNSSFADEQLLYLRGIVNVNIHILVYWIMRNCRNTFFYILHLSLPSSSHNFTFYIFFSPLHLIIFNFTFYIFNY
jgi:hypothetical protein